MATEREDIDDGGPALPSNHGSDKFNTLGLSRRDYFAAHALQGLLSATAHPQSCGYMGEADEFAQRAYGLADAMLRARGEHA